MRIVSLCPSLTELVFALDRGAYLVGITDYCIHPASGVARIEKVGGTKTPEVERIVDLAPDLVLLNDEENRVEDALALEEAGVRCLSSLPRGPGETAQMVRAIGRALDRLPAAELIAAEIETRTERVVETASRRAPVRFAYLIWRKPWMSVNGDTYAHSLLALAGGRNVFSDHDDRYPGLTPLELRQAAPEVLLLGSEPFPFTSLHADELAEETGIDRARVFLVDGGYLSWHGSRTPDGIDYAEQVVEAARSALSG